MTYTGGAWAIPGSGTPGVVVAPAPSGVTAIDQAAIATAIATAQAQNPNGGTVQLQAGKYAVSSSVNLVTVSNAGPGTAWTIVSGGPVAAGSYIVGPDVVGVGGTYGRSPLVTVGGTTSFTTDIAPGAVMASVVVWVVNPGILLPEGIRLRGVGSVVSSGASYWTATPPLVGTAIVDTGNGITVLTRGSNSYGARYGLFDLGIWGGNGNWTGGTGYTGSALVGLFLSNNSWWFEMDNVDISFYKTAGIALDGNMNASDWRNVSIQHIGTLAATTPTGGILCSFFTGATSAGINLHNCSIDAIYGMGIGGGQAGSPYASAVNLFGCQIWNVFATSFATYSGYGVVLNSPYNWGKCTLDGCWLGTNGVGDIWLNGGALAVRNTTCTSPVASPITNYGTLTLIGCDIYATSANAVSQHGSINAIGVALQGSATALYSGGPTAAQCLGIATSVGVALASTSYTSP